MGYQLVLAEFLHINSSTQPGLFGGCLKPDDQRRRKRHFLVKFLRTSAWRPENFGGFLFAGQQFGPQKPQ